MGWVVNATPRPGRFTPGKETRNPLYRRLGGPQGRSGQVRTIQPPPGFDPRTVQSVASRYTDWAIEAHAEKQSIKYIVLAQCCRYLAVHVVTTEWRSLLTLALPQNTQRRWYYKDRDRCDVPMYFWRHWGKPRCFSVRLSGAVAVVRKCTSRTQL
jgi:hypothetical protein